MQPYGVSKCSKAMTTPQRILYQSPPSYSMSHCNYEIPFSCQCLKANATRKSDAFRKFDFDGNV